MEDPEPEPYLQAINLILLQTGFSSAILISLIVIILLLIFSALVSGSEVAFFSIPKSKKDELLSENASKFRYIFHLLERPKRLLATILILNNFINVAIVILSYYFIHDAFNVDQLPDALVFLIDVVAITAILLLLGEIMPKILAANRALRFASLMARPLYVILKLLYPFSSLLVKSTNLIDRRIERRKDNISMDELSDALEITSTDDTPEEELKMLEGIIRFGDIEVKEIMKNRVDVVALECITDFPNIMDTVKESGYSRIPVYEESLDNIKGILYVKDLLPYTDKAQDFSWCKLIRPAFFVPESKKINDLLQEIRKKKIHLAIVVDEYGGTAGIVTLEDIIEEIIGEISDEFDSSDNEVNYRKLNDRTYSFEGKTSLNDFCKILDIDDDFFDNIKGDYDSLAGLLLEHFGELPEVNDTFEYRNILFKIIEVDVKRIRMVRVVIK